MARILSSQDIVHLLQADHFSLPNTRGSLVRSRSSHGLLRWNKVLVRCHDLLQTRSSRIERAQLSHLLDIEDDMSESLCRELEDKLCLSRDGRHIIPNAEVESIMRDLASRTENACVDLRSFAQEKGIDINLLHLERLIGSRFDESWRRFRDPSKDATLYVCSEQVVQIIIRRIEDAISHAGVEPCDLTYALSHMAPFLVLFELASEVVSRYSGTLRIESGRVVAMPASNSAASETKWHQLAAEQAQQLSRDGFCLIRPTAELTMRQLDRMHPSPERVELVEAILAAFANLHPNQPKVHIVPVLEDLEKISGPESGFDTVAIVRSDVLERQLQVIRTHVRTHTEKVWHTGGRSAAPMLLIQDALPTQRSVTDHLAKFLLRSVYVKEIEQVVREHIAKIELDEASQVSESLRSRLQIPLQLYSDGIAAILDTTLKEHLERFILDHFRLEAVPTLLESLEQRGLLHDKSRHREISKFRQSSHDARDFTTFQSASNKIFKKLSVTTTSAEALRSARRLSLQQSVRAMSQLTRGSDLLQNLIWICLASVSQGLFMSSGKDTTRMIKVYHGMGNAETALRLMRWRDLLKAGMETGADLEEIRELATKIMEEMPEPEKLMT